MAASGGTDSQALKVVGVSQLKRGYLKFSSSPAFCKFDQSKCRTAKLCILIGIGFRIAKSQSQIFCLLVAHPNAVMPSAGGLGGF